MTDVLAPFKTAIEKLSTKDATAALVALLLAYALIAFGIAASVSGALRWLVAATGGLGFLGGLGILGYAVVLRPDRLRSEETVRVGMLLEWIRRPDVDDEHRLSAATLLPVLLAPKQSKHIAALSEEEQDD